MSAAKARLKGDLVLVPDEREANTLHNKGWFGVPQSGGALLLDLAEALYLVENNRLAVEGHDAGSLLRAASRKEPDFEIRYIVYRDLRGRTFTVKPSNVAAADASRGKAFDYNVFPRGETPGRSASRSLVRCVSERGAFDPIALLDDAAKAKRLGKELLVGLVDEEGDLTYYEVREEPLEAQVQAVPDAEAKAYLLEDRVMVLDAADAKALHGQGYFGRDVGLGLQLSMPEALYLLEEGRLRVVEADGRRGVDAVGLARAAMRAEADFPLRHALYRHLRRRGLVVKTGFKYGTHFRVYVGPPDEEHAPYLVHAVAAGRRMPWPEVAGFVRLAHGVRKRLFFAIPEAGRFRLLELARTKP